MPHGSKDLAPALLRVHGLHRAWINGKEVVQIGQEWAQVLSEIDDTLGNLLRITRSGSPSSIPK